MISAAVGCIATIGVRPAAAQSNIAAAAKAFSLGQQAELAGNYRAASEHYELADRMVPSPEALRSAARARLKAGDQAIAATLAETLERRYSDEKSLEVAREILVTVRPALARVTLACRTPCGVVVDGGALGVEESHNHVFYVEPGRHTIGADFGDGVTAQQVFEGQAGKNSELTLAPPEAARETSSADIEIDSPSLPPPRPRGLRIGWFIGGVVVTVGLASASTWSGLDVIAKNDKYKVDPTKGRLDDGRRAELRTNILIGATAAAAVGTAVIAWKTRWSAGKRDPIESVGIAPTDRGTVLFVGGRFR